MNNLHYNKVSTARLKEQTIFLAEYAATLEAVGVQTSRIHYNTIRIAKAWGYWCNIMMFPQSISITLHDANHEHSFTYVKKTPEMALNFKVNMKLSHLSWRAWDEHLSLDELRREFRRIVAEPRESRWLVLFLAACANACFCRLFEGNPTSMGIVFIATAVGFFFRQELTHRHFNPLAVFVICSFISTMIGSVDFLFIHSGTEDISLGTSMLYLVPGVPIINGVMDVIDRHVLNGVARLLNALMLVACMAIGLSFTLLITHVDPNLFTHVTRPDVIEAALLDGAFAAVAGLGFAMISNPPRRALVISAFLASVGHAVRYLLMHHHLFMLDQATASTIAGFSIGLLAVPFAMKIHYPAEGFAFPAMLPMVPGMFAYKAVRDLINIVQLPISNTNEYMIRFFHNSSLAVLVMIGMVAGCVIPIFLFHRQSYQVTRETYESENSAKS